MHVHRLAKSCSKRHVAPQLLGPRFKDAGDGDDFDYA